MKFNWGTGIFLFLLLFMAALLAFVIFAYNQDVNLVHNDYYEKGVDHTRQMDKDNRSAEFAPFIVISNLEDSIGVSFPISLASSVESGNVLFFRPSDHNKDISHQLIFRDSIMIVSKEKLIPGRYIVKITWQANGLDYEIDKSFIVN